MDEGIKIGLILVALTIPYTILLLAIFRNLKKVSRFEPLRIPLSSVSIIIPCRNEEKNLPRLLESISAQDYPTHFEVIVVDDNSTDNTNLTAQEFSSLIKLQVLVNQGNGKKQALRTGIAAASGELIITIDADCKMGPGWLKTILSFYETHQPNLIICPVQFEEQKGFFGKFQSLEFLSLQGITAGTALAGHPVMCNGANLAFTRKTYDLHSANLHGELASGDDVFLLHSIKKNRIESIKWLESSEATVTTKAADGINSFVNQRKRWISKAGKYSDMDSIILGIVTFVTNLVLAFSLIAAIFNPLWLKAFLVIFLLKSLPDFLILRNTTARYGKDKLMRWFVPSQAVYPFYVIVVAISGLLSKRN